MLAFSDSSAKFSLFFFFSPEWLVSLSLQLFQPPGTALDLVTATLIPVTEIKNDNTKFFELKHQSVCRLKYMVADSPSDLDSTAKKSKL